MTIVKRIDGVLFDISNILKCVRPDSATLYTIINDFMKKCDSKRVAAFIEPTKSNIKFSTSGLRSGFPTSISKPRTPTA